MFRYDHTISNNNRKFLLQQLYNYLFLNLPKCGLQCERGDGSVKKLGVNCRFSLVVVHGEKDLINAFDLEQFSEKELGVSSR